MLFPSADAVLALPGQCFRPLSVGQATGLGWGELLGSFRVLETHLSLTRPDSVKFTSKPSNSTQSLHLRGDKYRIVPHGLAELAFSIKVMTLVCWEIF